MFENKREPQDIFEGVEPPANLPVAKPLTVTSSVSAGVAPQTSTSVPRPTIPAASVSVKSNPNPGAVVNDRHLGTGGHVWKTVLIVVIAFGVLGAAAVLAFSFLKSSDQKDKHQSDTVAQDESNDSTDSSAKTNDNAEASDDIEPVNNQAVVLDSDGDGLTNDQELAAGTNPDEPDTGNDALGDREEVQVYGTNPLPPDTDSDTFTDGQEIKSGYNPNGSGKLFEIPANVTGD